MEEGQRGRRRALVGKGEGRRGIGGRGGGVLAGQRGRGQERGRQLRRDLFQAWEMPKKRVSEVPPARLCLFSVLLLLVQDKRQQTQTSQVQCKSKSKKDTNEKETMAVVRCHTIKFRGAGCESWDI